MNPERFEMLMVKAVDDVASPAERDELMSHLKDKPELRAEYEAHLSLLATTQHLVSRLGHDLAVDANEADSGTRLVEGLGVFALVGGIVLLMLFGGFEFLRDPAIPLWPKVGAGLCGAGSLALLFSVIRGRLKIRPHDPYKEVIR
jgi:hypothetical protein